MPHETFQACRGTGKVAVVNADFWHLAHLPSAVALIDEDGMPLSYGQLSELVDEWARRVREIAGEGRPLVAMEFPTAAWAIAAYLGVLRADLPLLVVEPGTLPSDSAIARHWKPEVRILADGQLLPRQGFGLSGDAHADLKLLLSTSGTTGDPKLVRLSGNNIASNAAAIAEYLELTPHDRAITTLPLFYSYGLSVLNSHLAAGASLALTARSVVENAFWDQVGTQAVTSFALVPHQFDLLDRTSFSSMALPALRYITQAGGKLHSDTVRRYVALGREAGWDLFIMYGQTEASPRIAYVPPALLPQAAETIGRAIPGGRLWIVDAQDQEIDGAGTPGELVYSGPNVMMGYAEHRAELERGSETHQLRTGDIAERTADGLFRIVGRLKRFAKLFGLRISLDQVESLLKTNGMAVHAVAVDDRLVLLHETVGAGEHARDLVAGNYGLPLDAIHVGPLAAVPLLPSGKIDHRALSLAAADVLRVTDSRPPDRGASLRNVLMRATRTHTIQPTDSFTSLGGDSLSYLQVQMALEDKLGYAPSGWENLSIGELEALTPGETRRTSTVEIVNLLRIVAISLVVAQHASDYPLFGGPWMLLTVMGAAAARFQSRLIGEGRALQFGLRMLYPIVPLYFLIIGAYFLVKGDVMLTSIMLIGDYQVWTTSNLLRGYWFVSLYAQIVALLMIVALAVPGMVRRYPWRAAAAAAAMLLLAVGMLLQAGHYDASHIGLSPWPYYARQGLLECLPLFFTGWAIQQMRGVSQVSATVILATLVVAVMILLGMSLISAGLLAGTMILLATRVRIPMPAAGARVVSQMASFTLFVYLLNEPLVFVVNQAHLPEPVTVIVSLAGAFIVAGVAKFGFDSIDRLFRHLIAGWRPAKGTALVQGAATK